MTRVILDAASAARLSPFKEKVELCDEHGRKLGQFVPLTNRDLYEKVEVPVGEEELKAAEQELGGRTLAEILADLEKVP